MGTHKDQFCTGLWPGDIEILHRMRKGCTSIWVGFSTIGKEEERRMTREREREEILGKGKREVEEWKLATALSCSRAW